MMAMYMAEKMMVNKMDYSILKLKIYAKYKEDVDTILIAEGREDLIEEWE